MPGVNLATLRAAILISDPVWGLRPLRALRWDTENVPKPTRVTRSPFFKAAVTPSIMVSIAAAACVLLHLEELEIRSTRWPLFMLLSSAGRATTPPPGFLDLARAYSPLPDLKVKN